MKIAYSDYTHKGDRDVNEDSLSVSVKNGVYCFVLCDGLGGHGKGELASGFVTDYVKKYFESCDDLDHFLSDVLDRAQEGLLAEQKRIGAVFEMKTTAVVLVVTPERFRYAYIGDSRFYHFRRNKMVKRSIDHSVPQMLVLAGDIKEKQIRSHPDRNRLLRVMGVEWEGSRYETSEWEELQEGDAFLLCSDGFWEPIVEKEMCKLLKKSSDVNSWLDMMSERVLQNGKGTDMDNNSAIAVQILKE